MELVELAGEEVVHQGNLFDRDVARQVGELGVELGRRAELVLAGHDDAGRETNLGQPGAREHAHGQGHEEQALEARGARRGDPARGARSEGEPSRPEGQAWTRGPQVIEGSTQVVVLAALAVVDPLAAAHAAEVEAQDHEPRLLQGPRGAEDHVVVHRPPVEGMRMAHDRGAQGLPLGIPERSLQPPRGPFEVHLHGVRVLGAGSTGSGQNGAGRPRSGTAGTPVLGSNAIA